MLAAQGEDVDLAAAALVAQVPVLAVVKARLRWLAVLEVALAASVVLAQVRVLADVVVEAEVLLQLLSRRSFSAAMARTTT
jgi:hypothetical protein